MTDENNNFEARLLTSNDYKAFATVYNDFRDRAVTEYNFELEPLDFEGFTDAVEKNLIDCLVLYDNTIPVAFLVYTTAISEAIELNIIHSFKMENMVERAMYLIKKFLELTKAERLDKIVCYPMLGSQKNLIGDIARYGFKFVGIAVLRFMMAGTNSREILKTTQLSQLDNEYRLVDWQDKYFEDAVEVVQEGFETSADALFDPRFKTIEGTRDIISKIVKNIYAEFLPEATTVMLYNNIPVGFCFMNLTGGRIANIPIVSIRKEHQGKGLSKHMLKKSVEKLIEMADNGIKPITEVNTTTETNNFQALKMYRHLGFKEDYNYPQSYLPTKD
ncbi:predicted acetyltransferase (GNAT family) [Clostridium sp. CAG:768]|jgi:GNAT superfamily N-acetyltransferase|nr:predicted acetyltransferase (GNAT family) [Clostridium sp. CAG:768]